MKIKETPEGGVKVLERGGAQMRQISREEAIFTFILVTQNPPPEGNWEEVIPAEFFLRYCFSIFPVGATLVVALLVF